MTKKQSIQFINNLPKEQRAPKTAHKCSKCKIYPVWGAAFLVCLCCGQESEYNNENGGAVRSWNKNN